MKGPLDIVFGFVQSSPPISLILGSIGLLGLLISLFTDQKNLWHTHSNRCLRCAGHSPCLI